MLTNVSIVMLSMMDEYSRICFAVNCERHIGSNEVIQQLATAMITPGIPGYIRSDNGREFVADLLPECFQHWS